MPSTAIEKAARLLDELDEPSGLGTRRHHRLVDQRRATSGERVSGMLEVQPVRARDHDSVQLDGFELAEVGPVVPRLIGSAAVSLAAVAFSGGCLVGAGLETWDAAAGTLLAEERGRTVLWWKYAGDSSHHLLAGDADLVNALQPAMPDFISAWRRKADSASATRSRDELLGPSATIRL